MLAPIGVRAAGADARSCFAETGQCLEGRFLAYWQMNGGLAQFGFPVTGEQDEILENGKTYTVQYFERARFEYHPEYVGTSYEILLGQFGRRVLGGDFHGDAVGYQRAVAPVAPLDGARFFPATGHNLGGRFLAYWEAHGGLAQFGYPITDERTDGLADGSPNGRLYTTQYFERARLEFHPENAGTPYEVLLGQFGRRILADNALLAGPFRALYLTDEAVRLRFGRPLSAQTPSPGVLQAFERGRMYYSTRQAADYVGEPIIYVLCGTPERGQIPVGHPGAFYRDTWAEGQEPGGGPAPTPGLYYPKRGFGKVWRENPDVRECLGYATAATETAFPIVVQLFQSGVFLLSDTSAGRFIYAIHTFARCNSCAEQGDYERFPVQP